MKAPECNSLEQFDQTTRRIRNRFHDRSKPFDPGFTPGWHDDLVHAIDELDLLWEAIVSMGRTCELDGPSEGDSLATVLMLARIRLEGVEQSGGRALYDANGATGIDPADTFRQVEQDLSVALMAVSRLYENAAEVSDPGEDLAVALTHLDAVGGMLARTIARIGFVRSDHARSVTLTAASAAAPPAPLHVVKSRPRRERGAQGDRS